VFFSALSSEAQAQRCERVRAAGKLVSRVVFAVPTKSAAATPISNQRASGGTVSRIVAATLSADQEPAYASRCELGMAFVSIFSLH
jgi:hypothetical protein